ncbi:MAG: hypothetical protein VB020_00720, partial [Methanocorpusculum sp.]|nr:hypothetical protein [Methanocorpusculum sp.]
RSSAVILVGTKQSQEISRFVPPVRGNRCWRNYIYGSEFEIKIWMNVREQSSSVTEKCSHLPLNNDTGSPLSPETNPVLGEALAILPGTLPLPYLKKFRSSEN